MRDLFVFLGHDFFDTETDRKAAYRQAVQSGVRDANGYTQTRKKRLRFTVNYGDTRPEECPQVFVARIDPARFPPSNRFWSRIRSLIYACDLAIFDLTHRDADAGFLNANVILEYGVAIGFDKPAFPLGRDYHLFDRQLSNLREDQFTTYDTLGDLRREIARLLVRYHLIYLP